MGRSCPKNPKVTKSPSLFPGLSTSFASPSLGKLESLQKKA